MWESRRSPALAHRGSPGIRTHHARRMGRTTRPKGLNAYDAPGPSQCSIPAFTAMVTACSTPLPTISPTFFMTA